MRASSLLYGLAPGAIFLVACSGSAVVDPGTGGAGGTGNATSATTTTDASTSASTSTGNSTSVTTTGAGGAGGSLCDGLAEVPCVAAFPDCVPVYDDACCPTCDPGPCADCVNYQYHHCVSVQDGCLPEQPVVCGVIPSGACTGQAPSCGPPGGSPTPCGAQPGCIEATCSPDVNCPPDVECHPVIGGMCSTECDSVPPTCPTGTTAESDGFCYTGYCIPVEVCGG